MANSDNDDVTNDEFASADSDQEVTILVVTCIALHLYLSV